MTQVFLNSQWLLLVIQTYAQVVVQCVPTSLHYNSQKQILHKNYDSFIFVDATCVSET